MEQSGRDGFKGNTISTTSSFFKEFNDFFDNVDNVFNNTEMQETPASRTTYHCQLYRVIMSVGVTGSLVYLWNCG